MEQPTNDIRLPETTESQARDQIPRDWRVHAEHGAHIIRMGTALEDPAIHAAHHIIEWEHGLYPEDGGQYEEADAIARLIAAAPLLLEACEDILDWARENDGPGWMLAKLEVITEHARRGGASD